MQTTFKDYFSGHARQYARYRPDYPAALYDWLASLCRQHELAWDCASGAGQSCSGLTQYFASVLASDASLAQISNCNTAGDVKRFVATAENSALATASVDLICVAQALHWFDLAAFGQEVRRILRPGGVLAVWTYNLLQVSPELDVLIHDFYSNTLGAYWPFERKLLENGYADISLPFEEIPAPTFEMQQHWDLQQLIGYLDTWSAVKLFQQQNGNNPLEKLAVKLSRNWLPADAVKPVSWPLTVRAWRV